MVLLLIVYNLRGGLWGSVTPGTEQKDFHTQSTSMRVPVFLQISHLSVFMKEILRKCIFSGWYDMDLFNIYSLCMVLFNVHNNLYSYLYERTLTKSKSSPTVKALLFHHWAFTVKRCCPLKKTRTASWTIWPWPTVILIWKSVLRNSQGLTFWQ